MSLETFKGKIKKDKTKKRIIYTMISLCLLTSLIITSYAIYKIQQNKNLSNTKVGTFKTSDITVSVMVDGVKQSTFPTKDSGKVFEKLECTNSGSGTFNESTWTLSIDGITGQSDCTIYFIEKLEYADASGASIPDLEAGMIPVTWNGTKWVVADTSKQWYDYNAQWWANAINVTSSSRATYLNKPGTIVNMSDVLFMWVWVPRYEYQYTNLENLYAGGNASQPGGISIKFIEKTKTSPSTNYYIHNAFWWDNNNDGTKAASEQLSGIWVAKFELSSPILNSDTLQQPKSVPNVTSWTGARLGTFWTSIKNNMNSTTGNSVYGLSTSSDTHMMKNMEWGAVAYLTQSKYGKYGNISYSGANKEIYQNKSNSHITGCSYGSPSNGNSDYGCQYTYEKSTGGTGASTTGNIYGIYDMSGGAWEYVMGIEKVERRDEPAVGYKPGSQSGFAGYYHNNVAATETSYATLSTIGSKYYDLYEYSTSSSASATRYIPGDATHETAGWFSDYTGLVYQMFVFARRGGNYNTTTEAGTFAFFRDSGYANSSNSTRAVSVRLG